MLVRSKYRMEMILLVATIRHVPDLVGEELLTMIGVLVTMTTMAMVVTKNKTTTSVMRMMKVKPKTCVGRTLVLLGLVAPNQNFDCCPPFLVDPAVYVPWMGQVRWVGNHSFSHVCVGAMVVVEVVGSRSQM